VLSPGDSVVLPITIENRGFEEDFIEITVIGIPRAWVTIPVPIIRLGKNEKIEIELSINSPISSEKQLGQYPIKIRAISQLTSETMAEQECILLIAGVHKSHGNLSVLLDSTNVSVTPGSIVNISIKVINHSDDEESYNISIEGIPQSWIPSITPHLVISPLEEKEILLVIQPLRTSKSRAGRHRFFIHFKNQRNPLQTHNIECILTVAAYSQFECELHPKLIEAGESAQISVNNSGNLREIFMLRFQNPDNSLSFEPFDEQRIRLQPGESNGFNFSAKPRRPPIFGGDISYPYAITVQSSQQQSQILSGEVTSHGKLPSWVIPLLFIFFISVIFLIIFLVNWYLTKFGG
jgi:uncharacterized membrane protein